MMKQNIVLHLVIFLDIAIIMMKVLILALKSHVKPNNYFLLMTIHIPATNLVQKLEKIIYMKKIIYVIILQQHAILIIPLMLKIQ